MDSSSDQTHYDQLFKLLEPEAASTESGFRQCRLKLFKFFVWRRCEDPANLADETIVRLLKNVDRGQMISSGKPYSYVYAIASNVFREYHRTRERREVISDVEIAPAPTPESAEGCKEMCLQQLSGEKLELLRQYYLDERQQIAQKRLLTRNALRLKIHRIKQELRRCWKDCQKRSAT